jgi:hypothetical protein
MRSLGGALLRIRGRWIDRFGSIICAAPGMHDRCIAGFSDQSSPARSRIDAESSHARPPPAAFRHARPPASRARIPTVAWTLPKPSLTARVNPRLRRAFRTACPVEASSNLLFSLRSTAPPALALSDHPPRRLPGAPPPPGGHPPRRSAAALAPSEDPPRPSANPCRRLPPSIPRPPGVPAAAPPPAPCLAGTDSHGPSEAIVNGRG